MKKSKQELAIQMFTGLHSHVTYLLFGIVQVFVHFWGDYVGA
jgi:hypothetical protein